MLVDLEIGTYKLLADVHLTFGPGMTAITGETGVGKSMLLGAIAFLFGDRAGEEVFPADAQEVRVAGGFTLDPTRPEVAALIQQRLWDPHDDPEFVLERILARGGRSRFFLNGRRLTQAAAGTIGEVLLDVLG
ncbi:MAG TPA: AAA family ATPase, partial [bacterium]|nr:AAA family ATPase [bacterium]